MLLGVASFARRSRSTIEAAAPAIDPSLAAPSMATEATGDILFLLGAISIAQRLRVTVEGLGANAPVEPESRAPFSRGSLLR
jgi:hypothetical protein